MSKNIISYYLYTFLFLLTLVCPSNGFAEKSQCYGSPKNGRLENGVGLPLKGLNFTSYTPLAAILGRTYVHSEVRSIILEAYEKLAQKLPNKVYQYAETGFKDGGPFKPHITHQNGLSVDFMVPVLNQKGQSVHLPTHIFNKFGYDIEFDGGGNYKQYTIDYPALAAHLVELHQAATRHGHDIQIVVFDPKLQPKLFTTTYGPYLRKHVRFSKTRAWVRHDEHYHVNFKIPCKR